MPQDLHEDAEFIAEHIGIIRQVLKRCKDAAIAESGLTAPQVDLLKVLVDSDGLTLKELSEKLGLAHSTVSGIVDRLEHRGHVQRRPDERDKRYTRIYAAEEVKVYADDVMHGRRLQPIVDALNRAQPDERQTVLEGLATLRRILDGL